MVTKLETMRDYFFDQVRKGSYKPLTGDNLDRHIEEIYFSGEPLVSLTNKQEANVRESIQYQVSNIYDSDKLKVLASAGSLYFYFSPPIDKAVKKKIKKLGIEVGHMATFSTVPTIEADKHIFVAENFLGEEEREWDKWTEREWVERIIPALKDLGGTYLATDERIQLFKTLEGFLPGTMKLCGSNIGVLGHNYSSGNINGYDMRPLVGDKERFGKYANQYSYWNIVKDFKKLVKETKATTEKDQLTMLDVGGGRGCACYQAEQLCPEVTATNFAPTLPMALYPVNHIVGTAERMPASFRESYDLIFSNIAFRYFARADIALENIMHVLSIGGKASLDIETCLKKQIRSKFKRLENLASKGYFKFDLIEGNTGWFLEMTKLRSL